MSEEPRASRVCALIVAAGSSRRMGFDKLTVPLLGKPLIVHTLERFAKCEAIDDIVIVVAAERMKEFQALARAACGEKLHSLVQGGPERDASVWNGLRSLPKDAQYVAVHDAARPLVRPELIERCIEAARLHGGAACAEPLTETLQKADKNLRVTETIPRENLWRMQTPQVFRTDLLVDCYTQILREGKYVTDEASAFALCKREVLIVPNDDCNPKVTFPRDVPVVEWMLREANE